MGAEPNIQTSTLHNNARSRQGSEDGQYQMINSTACRQRTSSFSPSPMTTTPSMATVFSTLRIWSTAACLQHAFS